MKDVKYYQALEKILHDFVSRRVVECNEEGWLNEYRITYAEVDELMRELDSARFEEKQVDKAGQTGEKTEHPEAGLRDLQEQLLGSMRQVVPLMMLTPHLRRIEEALKKSAAADLARGIVECERFLLEIPDDVISQAVAARKERIRGYRDKLVELELDLAVLSKFHFGEGEVSFDVKPGTVATLIEISHRADGLPPDSPSEMVVIWIPTGQVKELKDKL